MPNTCTRSIAPDQYSPVEPLAVTLKCVVDASGASTYIVDEVYPAGWSVSDIVDGGVDNNTSVRWFFFDSADRALTYTLVPPAGTDGSALFGGTLDSDGLGGFLSVPMAGVTEVRKRPLARLHPANRAGDFRITRADALMMVADWIAGVDGALAGVPPGLRRKYVLRAAHIAVATSDGAYEDDGVSQPPMNWHPLVSIQTSARRQ